MHKKTEREGLRGGSTLRREKERSTGSERLRKWVPQEVEKAEKFCILLFQPLKTAEPSAITGWLGHESPSAVVCSLSAGWYCRGVWPSHLASNKHGDMKLRGRAAPAWWPPINTVQIAPTLCISFFHDGKVYDVGGASSHGKQMGFFQAHRWVRSMSGGPNSTGSHGTKATEGTRTYVRAQVKSAEHIISCSSRNPR